MKAIPAIILPLSDPEADLKTVGGKGMSLAKLANAGLPVPDGFHITTEAYQQFVRENKLQTGIDEVIQNVDILHPATLAAASKTISHLFTQSDIPADLADAIVNAYTTLAADEPQGGSLEQWAKPIAVAVRSSATAEDLPDASFAGQQETFLNVSGAKVVVDAVKRCWASLWTARAISYRVQQNIDTEGIALAVVVQCLVPADAAGIMFTANPVNGRRDQIVINASWGLGEAVVGGMVTPDSFTAEKTNFAIVAREIADKQTMTVRVAGGTEEQPVPKTLRQSPALEDTQVVELMQLGIKIEALYGMPMDIEWAIAGGVFSILQARPITALPNEAVIPEPEPPNAWKVPDPKAVYFRSSIVELLPDPLTPLFATLGIRAINAGTMKLFSDFFGSGVMPDDMYLTVNGYAYGHMRLTLKFLWQLLIRLGSIMPIFFRGEARWRDEARPQYLAVIEHWKNRSLDTYPAVELLEGASQITAEAVNIYNVYQSGVVGLAMGAEMLFTPFYEKLIRRKNDPSSLTLMVGGDSMPIRTEKSLYDVAQWCHQHPGLTDYLLSIPVDQLAVDLEGDQVPADVDVDIWLEWKHRFQIHLAQYGHAIYDLDFSVPVPADNPTPLLEMIKLYLDDQGTNPHERQQKQVTQREEAAKVILKRLKGTRLKWFRKLLGWSQTYVPMREDTLADIGLGYPLLRQMLSELGDRLVQAGMLEKTDDVYWLYEDELLEATTAIDRGETLSQVSETIRQRQAVWRAAKRVTPPTGLPERSGIMGMLEKIGPTRTQEEGDTIKGVGASPGRVSVPACVLRGPEDFDQMQPGAALVAAITTPAWTPLFAMASAIVTDVGGPLSHGSIVAREYGIPAVLGTGVATKRIQSGQIITVDGDAGTVTLSDKSDTDKGGLTRIN